MRWGKRAAAKMDAISRIIGDSSSSKLAAWRAYERSLCTQLAASATSAACPSQTRDSLLEMRHLQLQQTYPLSSFWTSPRVAIDASSGPPGWQATSVGRCVGAAKAPQGRTQGGAFPRASAYSPQTTAPDCEVWQCRARAGKPPLTEELQRLETAEETLARTSLGAPDGLKLQLKELRSELHGCRPEGRQLDQSPAKVKRIEQQKAKQEDLIKDLREQLTQAEADLTKIIAEENEANQAHLWVKQQLSSRDDALYLPPSAIDTAAAALTMTSINLSNAMKEATNKGCAIQEADVAQLTRAQLQAMAKVELEPFQPTQVQPLPLLYPEQTRLFYLLFYLQARKRQLRNLRRQHFSSFWTPMGPHCCPHR